VNRPVWDDRHGDVLVGVAVQTGGGVRSVDDAPRSPMRA